MEYTVQNLAALAGISRRTLRYYDEINILKPARINSSGYRIYGQKEVDRLQQIMFYRELGMSLNNIKSILSDPDFNEITALKEHRQHLLKKREQFERLITNVDKTIASKERKVNMSDLEKFEGFKKSMIEENETKYGKEIRQKYGQQAVDQANQKVMNMTKEEHEAMEQLSNKLTETLKKAFETGNPASNIAQQAADLHKQWLSFYWKNYSKEAHANLAQSYVDDERFTAYYDKEQPGTAAFLRDAIHIYTGLNQ